MPLDIKQNWRSEFKRLEGAYAPATMRSYRADVEAFETWCKTRGLPPFPATIDTVCRFIEEQGREKAPSTVRRRLYAIRKVHRLLRLPDPTQDEEINLALRRVKRAKRTRPRQARGMTRALLDRFVDCQPATPWGLRNRAMLTLGYELLARRSELVALRNDDVTWRDDGTLRVLIRRSKSDPYGEGRIAFTSRVDRGARGGVAGLARPRESRGSSAPSTTARRSTGISAPQPSNA
jgi:integrase/recombinase XerD